MHKTVLFALGLLAATPACAAGMEIEIELPRIDVADYRAPMLRCGWSDLTTAWRPIWRSGTT